MDLKAGSGPVDDEGIPGGGSGKRGGFAMELRDLLLLLRTRVWASENAVSHRGGTSAGATARATGGGRSTPG